MRIIYRFLNLICWFLISKNKFIWLISIKIWLWNFIGLLGCRLSNRIINFIFLDFIDNLFLNFYLFIFFYFNLLWFAPFFNNLGLIFIFLLRIIQNSKNISMNFTENFIIILIVWVIIINCPLRFLVRITKVILIILFESF